MTGPEKVVWEAGCGSGQFTTALVEEFIEVVATDTSLAQLAGAPQHHRVRYLAERAESSALRGGFADLCIAAQSAHWFDLKRYYSEVRRVGKTGGLVGLASYSGVNVEGEVNRLVQNLLHLIAPYWPGERHHVHQHYRSLWFPFDEVSTPQFTMQETWDSEEFLGYIRTWSAVGRATDAAVVASLVAFERQLLAAWPRHERRNVRWRLVLRLGRL